MPPREIERANLAFGREVSADESKNPAGSAAEARPTIAHNGNGSLSKKGETHGHYPPEIDDLGLGTLINFQMVEAARDLYGKRTREQKMLQFPA
ncbi:hypothetical protein ATY30_06320 [Sinorhizobium americanum]|nr:hypothetical protein CO664_02555 [Sinorhizobium sp. NG07B]POH31118.1 hypothetical protein ATY30_06320 [Sinorhizobium americanum]